MRNLKILGLAAVAAMALMAFFGASTASALTFCKTIPNSNNECPAGWHYGIGTTVHETQKAGTTAVMETTGGEPLVTCTETTYKSHTTTTGGLNQPVRGVLTSFIPGTLSTPCTTTVDATALGEFAVEATSGGNGTLVGSGTKVTVSIFGVSCVYGTGTGTTLGTMTGGEPATADINAVINKQEGGFLCPSTTKWTGTYVMTQPNPVWFANA